MKLLSRFPEYVAFQRPTSRQNGAETSVLSREQTPEEILEATVQGL